MASPPRPERPCLRRLETLRHEQAGTKGIVLRDPLGLARPVFVPAALVPLVARCDGTHSPDELAKLARRTLPGAPSDLVPGLLRDLADAGVLESEEFSARVAAEAARFGDGGVRPVRHAGSAGYPHDPAALRSALARLVPLRNSPDEVARRSARPAPRGLVAPHIDLARGALGYRAAYAALAECAPADLYVVIGTGHQGPDAPLTGLELDWDTPLGRLATAREFVRAVHTRIGVPRPRDVLLHRDEHSVEFQMLLLRWVLGERPARVAGFLTGSLPTASADPLDEPWVAALVAALREAAAEHGGRVCWIAGADLAHRGPLFGDPAPVDGPLLRQLEARERARLALLAAGEPGRFLAAVDADANADRVCGGVPMLLVGALAGGPAELLHYGQARANDGSQVVSYCAARYG